MKVKRTCMAKTFYPHLDLDSRAKTCQLTFMGEEKTIFCHRCAEIISVKRNTNGDVGIEHSDNPYNRPGGKDCGWYKCNRQAPPNRRYCGPTCQRRSNNARHSTRQKKDRAESTQPVVFDIPAYSRSNLQQLSARKFGDAVNAITAGRADMSG